MNRKEFLFLMIGQDVASSDQWELTEEINNIDKPLSPQNLSLGPNKGTSVKFQNASFPSSLRGPYDS